MSDPIDRAVDTLRRMPGLYQLRRAAYNRAFEQRTDNHMFRGVYASFEAAAANVPATRPLGYDNPRSAAMYVNQLSVLPRDYPALFWLSRALADGLRRVVDLGGSVGIKYFAFRALLDMPQDLRWTVVDVPAVAERGRALSQELGGGAQLAFSSDLAEADGADVLYASGSLQYLPQTFAQLLAGWPRKPRRMVINATPLHRERSFYTINSIGTAFCPYRIASEGEFIAAATASGYRLRDRWIDTAKQVRLPFESGYDVEHYSGFCFELSPD